MKNHSTHSWKNAVAKVLVAVMIMMSVLTVPHSFAAAASAPTITKTTKDIFSGTTYNLNINNKVKKSSYTWTSSNKSIATVSGNGFVKGIAKGTAVITCTVKAPTKTYKLTCKVTILQGATAFSIKNKVTALNVGQKYNIDRILTPSTSKEITTWTSNNTSIAAPDARGKFTALKVGTVIITGTTTSGKTDSMTVKIVDKDGIVTTQQELNALLGSGVALITLRTNAVVDITIPSGNYSKTKLVVDAPKADVHNNGIFSSIDIKQIATNSWYENAIGNLLHILATDSRIVVAANAVVRIDVNELGAKLKIENNGVIQEVVVAKPADIDFSGTSTTKIPITINVPDITITTSVPLNLNCNKKIDLVLLAGSEATKIQAATVQEIPSITGNVTMTVTIGSGANATQQEVIPTPIVTPTPTPGGGGTVTPTPSVTETVNGDGSVSYTLAQPYTHLATADVVYHGITYAIDSATIATLKLFLDNDPLAIALWKATTNTTNTYNGQDVTVSGTGGSSTKTVTFTGGQLNGKSYLITVGDDYSVTITNIASNITFTVSKVDNYTIKISAGQDAISFLPTYN